MIVSRKSPFTGIVHTLEIDVTQEQLDAHDAGTLVQDAMPNLTPEERDFIVLSITPEEYKTFIDDAQELGD